MISDHINKIIIEYNKLIAEHYPEVDEEDLTLLWESYAEDITSKFKQPIQSIKQDNKQDNKTCPYVFTSAKAARQGEKCGKKVYGQYIYCSIHRKYENKEVKEKKLMPNIKNNPKVIKIVKHDVLPNQLWHPPTELAFSNDKKVIGKIKDNKVFPLTNKEIDICKEWGFAFAEKVEKVIEPSDKEKFEEFMKDELEDQDKFSEIQHELEKVLGIVD